MQDLQYLIWLTATAAIPPQKAWALLSAFGGARAVYEAPAEALARAVPLTPAERLRLRLHTLAPAQTVLERCRRGGIRLLPIFDPDYPERLKNIYDPPVLLYVRGTLPPLGRMAAITVVGTRRCTPYGALTAERFGYQLSAAGAAVISGMERAFAASRYDKGTADYLNCPLTREEYAAFVAALREAREAPVHGFEDKAVFEGCMVR